MSKSYLTIRGLFLYDNTIFDKMYVPDGIVRETLIETILLRTDGLETLYPNTTLLSEFIKSWSNRNKWNWDELVKTMHYVYDAIENYDRKEEWTDEATGDSTRTPNLTTRAEQTIDTDRTNTQQNSAFNDGFKDNVKEIGKVGELTNGEETVSGNEKINNNSTSEHYGRVHGNIGVTTTQKMIEEQRKSVMFNIYDIIADDFAEHFCILDYGI